MRSRGGPVDPEGHHPPLGGSFGCSVSTSHQTSRGGLIVAAAAASSARSSSHGKPSLGGWRTGTSSAVGGRRGIGVWSVWSCVGSSRRARVTLFAIGLVIAAARVFAFGSAPGAVAPPRVETGPAGGWSAWWRGERGGREKGGHPVRGRGGVPRGPRSGRLSGGGEGGEGRREGRREGRGQTADRGGGPRGSAADRGGGGGKATHKTPPSADRPRDRPNAREHHHGTAGTDHGGPSGGSRSNDRERERPKRQTTTHGGPSGQPQPRRRRDAPSLFDEDDRDEALAALAGGARAANDPEAAAAEELKESVDVLTAEVYRRTQAQVERDAPPGLAEEVRGELEDDDEATTSRERRRYRRYRDDAMGRGRENVREGSRVASTPVERVVKAGFDPAPARPPLEAIVTVVEPTLSTEAVARMRDSLWVTLLSVPHNVTISRENQLTRELDFFEPESDDFADADELGKDLGKKGRLPEGETLYRFAFPDPRTGAQKRLDLEATLLPHLPDLDLIKTAGRHDTCAVVGNSGVLLQSERGAEIDAHEAVIRINYAPTQGFEKLVGSRTTYDLVNKENAGKLARGGHKWRTGGSTVLLFEANSVVTRRDVYPRLFEAARSQAARSVKPLHRTIRMLAPTLVASARTVYETIRREVEGELRARLAAGDAADDQAKAMLEAKQASSVAGAEDATPDTFEFHGKPMSGAVAVFFALQMCSKVDLYGFDAYTALSEVPYHYFDARVAATGVHSFDLAVEAFRRISLVMPDRLELKTVGRLMAATGVGVGVSE